MALKPKDKAELRGTLERMPDSVLTATRESAERLMRDQQDMNSRFPATQEFLKERGLTNVRQLDAKGKAELAKHLTQTLNRLRN